MASIEKIVFVEPKKLEGSDMPINPFSVGRKNAIIHFSGISEATNALATLHNFEIDGVQVRFASPCCAQPRARPAAVDLRCLPASSHRSYAQAGPHQFFTRCGERGRIARHRGCR